MSKSIYDCKKCGTYATSVGVMGIYYYKQCKCGKSGAGSSKREANRIWKEQKERFK